MALPGCNTKGISPAYRNKPLFLAHGYMMTAFGLWLQMSSFKAQKIRALLS